MLNFYPEVPIIFHLVRVSTVEEKEAFSVFIIFQKLFFRKKKKTQMSDEKLLLCDGCGLPIEKTSSSMTVCSYVDGNCYHFHLIGKIEDWCYHKYRPDLVKSQWEMGKKRYSSCSDGKHDYSHGEEFNPPYLVAILGQKRCEKCLH